MMLGETIGMSELQVGDLVQLYNRQGDFYLKQPLVALYLGRSAAPAFPAWFHCFLIIKVGTWRELRPMRTEDFNANRLCVTVLSSMADAV